jgi:hypothetical protein
MPFLQVHAMIQITFVTKFCGRGDVFSKALTSLKSKENYLHHSLCVGVLDASRGRI